MNVRRLGISDPYETTDHALYRSGSYETTSHNTRMRETTPHGMKPCRSVRVVRSVRADFSEHRRSLTDRVYDLPPRP
ncbi:hypothetical protein BHE74_00032928 [Ensete ventricosum]|nr:hypothetical protein BHE74_00032928 [Ensete ventricosum]